MSISKEFYTASETDINSGISNKSRHIKRRRRKRKYPSPITLRLSNKERAELKRLASGMTISAYIRECVFGDQATKRKRIVRAPTQDQQALVKVLGLLGESRIANNLNQLAYHANTDSLDVNDKTLRQIEEAYQHVCSMRDNLIKALGLIENN